MEFTEDWKSLWPIGSLFSHPLLIKPPCPLLFNPCPETLTRLFRSSSLRPHLPPPFPSLSAARFLATSSDVLPSTASSIAALFGHQTPSSVHNFNALQLLHTPSSVLAFFPAGENYNQVGFATLILKDAQLTAKLLKHGKPFMVEDGEFFQGITRLLVNPIGDDDAFSGNGSFATANVIGYLLVCTMYTVRWYTVKINNGRGDEGLCFVGIREFSRRSVVVNACWSQHFREESLVLLENGELFLFGVSRGCKLVQGNKLAISWDCFDNLKGPGQWLSCEFSWHPQIVIVAHSRAVFLVDLRSGGNKRVSCLLEIQMVSKVETDAFVSLTGVGSDGFSYAITTNHILALCDVRNPNKPSLKWLHYLHKPTFLSALRLDELRSSANDDKYKSAFESGYCILLGSFWDSEFCLFCYGPDNSGGSIQVHNSLKAWGLSSELLLSGHECNCGSCLIKDNHLKDTLPDWTDWRQKKDLVLGFGILDRNFSRHLSESDSVGGFWLIRLLSSGKLEAERYSASWEFTKPSNDAHNKISFGMQDDHLYDMGEMEFDEKYKDLYRTFDFIKGYLKNNLSGVLDMSRKNNQRNAEENGLDSLREKCQKLRAYGLTSSEPSIVSDMFEGIFIPTSIHEIAVRWIWTHFPAEVIQLVFTAYSKFNGLPRKQRKTFLEFLDTSDETDMPPDHFLKPTRNKSTLLGKVQLVNPAPLHFLIYLHNRELNRRTIQSSDAEILHSCDEVRKVAEELTMPRSRIELQDEHVVSLADDTDDICNEPEKLKLFAFHEPGEFAGKISGLGMKPEKFGWKDEETRFKTFVYRKREELLPSNWTEMNGSDLLDIGCPVELNFAKRVRDFGPNEQRAYKLLKKLDLDFQKDIELYQEYITSTNFLKRSQ